MKNKINLQKETKEMLERSYKQAISENIKRGIAEAKRRKNENK